jgi:hypothetical protein
VVGGASSRVPTVPSSADLREELLQERQGPLVLRAVCRLLRTDNVLEGGYRYRDPLEGHRHRPCAEVSVAPGPRRCERKIQITEPGDEIEEVDAGEKRRIAGERKPLRQIGSANPGFISRRAEARASRFDESRAGQMSASKVIWGEPYNIAATPPITT